MAKRKYKFVVFAFVTFILVIVFGPFLSIYVYSILWGRHETASVAEAIATNESDLKTILSKIGEWQQNHITYDARFVYFYPFPPFIMWRMLSPNPAWVMSIKRGACEEIAILFTEMVRSLGIQCRTVYNLGEDHVWSEVLINGSWTHVDSNIFNDRILRTL
jgi:transglutaminase/protease-like cytokinesis protein 3